MKEDSTNQYGLSRYIPSEVRRQIRKECGFGCVKCGSAIYEYEHIEPEFNKAKMHDPARIALLCGSCHSLVTRGLWSKEMVIAARHTPYCKTHQESHFRFDLSKDSEYVVKIGNTYFANLESIIEIDDKVILSVRPPEDNYAPFRISAMFFDRNNKLIALIEDNEWKGQADAFDIETVGPKLEIRSELSNIDFRLRIEAPNCIVVEKINLLYNGKKIIGTEGDGFIFEADTSKVNLPDVKRKVNKAPFWTWIKGKTIYVGTDNIADFTDLKGNKSILSGYYIIDGVKTHIEAQNEIKDSKNKSTTDKISFTSTVPDTGIGIHFEIPNSDDNIISLQNPKEMRERNKLCLCGTKRKYKYCCEPRFQKLQEMISKKEQRDIYGYFIDQHIPVSFGFNSTLPTKFQTSVNDSIVLTINSTVEFTGLEIARNLMGAKKIKEGFLLIETQFFNDPRQQIVSKLYERILDIAIDEELRRLRFNLSKEISVILYELNNTLSSKKDLQCNIGHIHYGAIEYINFNYKTFTSSFYERIKIEQLFEEFAPKSMSIGSEMIRLINESNPYTPYGFTLSLYKCTKLLDTTLPFSQYGPFLEFLKDRI